MAVPAAGATHKGDYVAATVVQMNRASKHSGCAPDLSVDLPRGLVFDIQRFSVHDGPGVRTTVFLKGCPLRCDWCQNPESLNLKPEIAFFADRCVRQASGHSAGRGTCEAACAAACESAAIRWTQPGLALEIERDQCQACAACTGACGYGALELAGQSMSADEVLEKVKADAPFYQASGGGVTISGGEPMQQAAFVAALVDACHRAAISVGLQTCGAYAAAGMEAILERLSFIHYDLKIIDQALHRELVGADNAAILRNARELVRRHAPVVFRRLIVPGVNDSGDELARLASFLHDIGQRRITLLQFHSMGDAKRPRIGLPSASKRPSTAQAQAALQRARQELQTLGIEVST